jgi:uncharacterized protein (TIGR03663 family)
MSVTRHWLPIVVVALAFLVRVWALGDKPPHFDEGVNGSFVDEMRHIPAYHYDPANFHGPLHFYTLFASTQLFGRGIWALRFPTVLVGTAAVALVFAFGRFFSKRAVFVAAAAFAISPAMIFYSRYAIHETWLPFFSILALYGAFGISTGERRMGDLWAVGAGLAGMVLTKETYILHFAAAALAWQVGRWMFPVPKAERTRPATLFGVDEALPELIVEKPAFRREDVLLVVGVCLGVIVALYSGLFYRWRGVGGIFETFYWMARKGWTGSEDGHHKELLYFVKLFGIYEWPAFAGLALAPLYAFRRSLLAGGITAGCGLLLAVAGWLWTAGQPIDSEPFHSISPVLKFGTVVWSNTVSLGVCLVFAGICWMVALPLKCPRMRFLALYGIASLAAYSFVSYKTPWCVVAVLWPFWFLLGHLFDRMTFHSDGRLVAGLGIILALPPFIDAHRINFVNPTNSTTDNFARLAEPYIYVQQSRDLENLTKPLAKLIEREPARRALTGYIICKSPQPLPWALPELPHVTIQSHEGDITFGDADFLLVHESRVAEVESQLLDVYFRSRFRFYTLDDNHQLYLRATTFHDFVLEGRVPEFRRRVPMEINEGEQK